MLKYRQLLVAFSKLQYFMDNYQMTKFETNVVPKTSLQHTLEVIKSGKNSLANNELQTFLKQGQSMTLTNMIGLLHCIYQSNLFMNRANHELVKNLVKQILITHQGDNEVILMGQYISQLGITDPELSQKYISVYLKTDLIQLNPSQNIDLLFTMVGMIGRSGDIQEEDIEHLKQKTSQLIMIMTGQFHDDKTIYLHKFPHIAHIYRTISKIEIKGIFEDDFHIFFKLVAEQFMQSPIIPQLEVRELTILLISLVKILQRDEVISDNKLFVKKSRIPNEEIIKLIINSTIDYVSTIPLDNFSDHSLMTLTLSLTILGRKELGLMINILETVGARIMNNNINSKFHLGILFEFYVKQNHMIKKGELITWLSQFNLKEISDYDFSQYMHLMTLVPRQTLQELAPQLIAHLKTRQSVNDSVVQASRVGKSLSRIVRELKKQDKCDEIISEMEELIRRFRKNVDRN